MTTMRVEKEELLLKMARLAMQLGRAKKEIRAHINDSGVLADDDLNWLIEDYIAKEDTPGGSVFGPDDEDKYVTKQRAAMNRLRRRLRLQPGPR